MVQLLDGAIDLLAELLPFQMDEGNPSNRLGCLDRRPVQLSGQALARLFVAERHGLQLFGELLLVLMEVDDIDEVLAELPTALGVGQRPLLHITDINDIVEFLGSPAQLLGQIEHHELDQGRTADRFLHPQLTALHAPGKVHLALPRQQRNSAHLTEIHTDRIVGVDGLFHRRGLQEIGFVGGLRIEELSFVLKIKAQRFRIVR